VSLLLRLLLGVGWLRGGGKDAILLELLQMWALLVGGR
jgi:hypothetical protein